MNYEIYLLDAADCIMNESYADDLDERALGEAVVGAAQCLCHWAGD